MVVYNVVVKEHARKTVKFGNEVNEGGQIRLVSEPSTSGIRWAV